MNFVLKLVTIAAVGLGCSNVAAAQDFFMPGSSPMDYNQIQSGVLTQQIDSLSIQRLSRVQAGRGASRSYGRGTPSSGVGRSGLAAFETSYRVSAAESRQALDAYVKRIARKNPEAARLTDAQFRRHDASKIWRHRPAVRSARRRCRRSADQLHGVGVYDHHG